MENNLRYILIAFAFAFGMSFNSPSCAIRSKAHIQGSTNDDKKTATIASLKSVVGPKTKEKASTTSARKNSSLNKSKNSASKKVGSKTNSREQTAQAKEDTIYTEIEEGYNVQAVPTKENTTQTEKIEIEYKPIEVRPQINPIYTVKAVDLGLSVEWADRNLGADKSEDSGNYYAWGEIKPKTVFKWNNYLEGRISAKSDCGTNNDPLKGFVAPYDKDLSYKYDAATMSLGGDWRIPSKAEYRELVDKCEWQWVEINGVAGSKVTGPNGNSIFIPASGWSDTESYDDIKNIGYEGYYWTATASVAYPESAYVCNTFEDKSDKGVIVNNTDFRFIGFTIRAVRTK